MKKIITNVNLLREEDMTDFTAKVKLLLLNSKNELLLGYSNHDYQFPGGTQEPGETLITTVKRELMEETGIELNVSSIEPFAVSWGYYKDWPEIGRNKKVEIYYYEIKTNEVPNLDKMQLTDDEKAGHFELRYIPIENVVNELDKNIREYGDKKGIAREMKELIKIYLNNEE